MKIITLSVFAALAVGVSSVSADERLTDAEYLLVGRCAGLAAGLDHDAEAWRAAFRAGGQRRAPMVSDQARRQHDEAQRVARRADERRRERLAEELEGRCAAFGPSQP